MKKWTIALLLLIIADSIFTIFIGRESSPIILYIMKSFNISLEITMIIRILYCLPFLYIVNKYNFSRFTFLSYIGIYMIASGVQF